ncbi:MAG: MarC family protein [Marinibacterium sp.]
MVDTAFLITAFATLFVIIDPIGLTPVFLALTRDMDKTARRRIAARSCGVAVAVLTLFALFGDAVLGFVGISMPAFRVAGGILLFLTALDMLFERRGKRREGQAEQAVPDHADDPSVFPLAVPLIAGPGSIATMILLAGQTPDWTGSALAVGVMLVVIAICYILFLSSGLLERLLGPTGVNVITRLLGMLLAALSVQFVMDGLAAFGLGGQV